METCSDFVPLAGFRVSGRLPITAARFDDIGRERENIVRGRQFALWRLEAQRQWTRDNIWNDLKEIADTFGIKVKDCLAPLFVAIAGSSTSFSVADSMELLGPDMSRHASGTLSRCWAACPKSRCIAWKTTTWIARECPTLWQEIWQRRWCQRSSVRLTAFRVVEFPGFRRHF